MYSRLKSCKFVHCSVLVCSCIFVSLVWLCSTQTLSRIDWSFSKKDIDHYCVIHNESLCYPGEPCGSFPRHRDLQQPCLGGGGGWYWLWGAQEFGHGGIQENWHHWPRCHWPFQSESPILGEPNCLHFASPSLLLTNCHHVLIRYCCYWCCAMSLMYMTWLLL